VFQAFELFPLFVPCVLENGSAGVALLERRDLLDLPISPTPRFRGSLAQCQPGFQPRVSFSMASTKGC
jgi:hypothetical protein